MLQRRKGAHLGPKIPKISQRILGTKTVHTSGTCLENVRTNKTKFKPYSHIELNTTTPNTIFKITTYCTKHTKNTKILSKIEKLNRQFTPKSRHAQTFPDTQSNP